MHNKLLCFLFTYCQSFPHFYNHQIVISISVSPPERLYIEDTGKLSPLYESVISLVCGFPIMRW